VFHIVTYLTHQSLIDKRLMSSHICLSSEFNASTLTTVNLNVVKLMTEALLFKTEEDSISLLH